VDPTERLRQSLELAEIAEEMLVCKLRRTHPDASPKEIERMVRAWYGTRPGAEHGDAEGVVVDWPRRET
jgi:hypothetical protein